MSLHIVTRKAEEFRNTEPGVSFVTLHGTNIVSAGVQTNNNQSHLWIVQMFCYDNGKHAYIQVVNTKREGSIGWKWVAVEAFDSADAAKQLPEIKAEFGSAPMTA
jgi:hypothetical protein